MKKWIAIVLIGLLVLSGCNFPTPEEDYGAKETSIALTVAAEVGDENTDSMDEPQVDGDDADTADDDTTGEETNNEELTATPKPTATSDEIELGEGDMAEFIADVTIPDYSEIETGEEITKTWRIRNTGSTTWDTSYMLEFEKGEKLGASTQIPLGKEVAPGDMIDISIDFQVPGATGEYNSYWILKNDENKRVGVEAEGKYLELYMIILVVDEDGGGSSGGSSGGSASITGGAKITGASVTVSPSNYNGSCPAQITFNYSVTTSNAGKVQFNLVFNVVSPSGYKFDPPPQYLNEFTSGYTVKYDYLLFSSDPVTATVRVRAVGENEFLSAPVQFTVKCN